MENIVLILAVLALLGTTAALILGLINTVRTDKNQAKRSNRLMKVRVGLQAVSIALIALLVVLSA